MQNCSERVNLQHILGIFAPSLIELNTDPVNLTFSVTICHLQMNEKRMGTRN